MASIKTVLELANQQFLSAIKQSEDSVKNFAKNAEQQTGNIDKAFGGLKNSATVLASSMAALGGFTAAFADDMADLATAHQTTIAEVLGLGKALSQNGGKMDNVGKMMQSMANNMDSAADGNLKMLGSFDKLGVSLSDIASMSETDIRNTLIKNIADISDPAERAAKAVSIFGKAAMGVNFLELANSIDANTKKYAEHEAALQSAADAFDAMQGIMTNLKIAFAEAFKPFFDAIAKINPEVKTLETGLKLLAIGIAAVAGTAAVASVMRLVTAFKALRVAVASNPLGLIATLVSTAAASYLLYSDSTEEATEVTKENTEATKENNKVKRDIGGATEAINKQRDALIKVTDSFKRQNEDIQKKLNLELQSLGLTEEQKRVSQQLSDIEQNKEKALLDLKTQYFQLDAEGRARQAATYAEQQSAIIKNAEIEKKAAEESIKRVQTLMNAYKSVQSAIGELANANEQAFNSQAKAMIDNSGYTERIELETKLTEVQRIRALMTSNLTKFSERDRSAAAEAVSKSTTDIALLGKSYEEIAVSIRKAFEESESGALLSKEAMDDYIQSVWLGMQTAGVGARNLYNVNKQIADQSRTFTAGWDSAFREYTDSATNAAKQAQQIFTRVTSSMEDAFVNFAKTGKFEFKSMINSIIEDLLRMQIKATMAKLMGLGGGTGATGGLFGGKIIPGILASGGPVSSNRPYIVGERGPELFMPGVNGQMFPNSALGGGQSVVYNIQAVDAPSFQALVARDPSFIHAVAMAGAKAYPR